MCGRFSITSPPEAVGTYFGYEERPNFPPRYNIAPTQPIPIVRAGLVNKTERRREFALVRWGFVPSWAKQIGSKPLINARSETVADKPSFRAAFRHRRCLVPADGYYEWQRGGTGVAQPFHIRPGFGGMMAMAGIWECWISADGSELETVAILTMAASPALKDIHHRMPCVLDHRLWDGWLDSVGTDRKAALAMLVPPPEDYFKAVKVSTAVNRVANDRPDLQVALETPDSQPVSHQPRLL